MAIPDEVQDELAVLPGLIIDRAEDDKATKTDEDEDDEDGEFPDPDYDEELCEAVPKSEPGEEYDLNTHGDDFKPGFDDKFIETRYELAYLQKDLFLPLRVYVMADKYDVASLRLLARDRFYRAAEATYDKSEHFPAVVDELYSCTRQGDIAMREIVCRLVASQMRDDALRAKMEPVMRKHGDFAADVINYHISAQRLDGKDW